MAWVVAHGCTSKKPVKYEPSGPFWPARQAFKTSMVKKQASPQPYRPLKAVGQTQLFKYSSGDLELTGLWERPKSDALKTSQGYPVLLYLHGGYALGLGDVRDCQPFLDAGFAVVAPSYRGENGNPGYHELYFGELEDALAALRFVGNLPDLDPDRMIVFGHSAGGNLSGLMSLVPKLPIQAIGSAGGFYDEYLFEDEDVPFAPTRQEMKMRLPYHWLDSLQYEHFACAGKADAPPYTLLQSIKNTPRLRVNVRSGDHFTSLPTCMKAFLSYALPKLTKTQTPSPPL